MFYALHNRCYIQDTTFTSNNMYHYKFGINNNKYSEHRPLFLPEDLVFLTSSLLDVFDVDEVSDDGGGDSEGRRWPPP